MLRLNETNRCIYIVFLTDFDNIANYQVSAKYMQRDINK